MRSIPASLYPHLLLYPHLTALQGSRGLRSTGFGGSQRLNSSP